MEQAVAAHPSLNVLLVVPWDQELGGVLSVVTNLAKHLEQRGHGVVMLHPGNPERPTLRKTIRGFTGYEYNLRTPLIRGRPVRSLIAFLVFLVPTLLRLSRVMRYHRIGVVNLHYPVEGFVYFGYFGILRYLLPAKLVISVHGADLFPGGTPRKRYPWSLRFLLRSAHALVAPSAAFLRDCSERFPAAFKRGVSIHNGIDTEELAAADALNPGTRATELFTSQRMGSNYERLYFDLLGASKPAKSLLISHLYFPPGFGGITRLLERMAYAMGPEKLCCLTGVPGPGTREANGGLRVYRSGTVFSGSTKVARAAAWVRTMGSIMIRERPRTVLLGTVYDGAYGRWLQRWLGLPYVTLAYGNEILGILMEERGTGKASNTGETLRRANRVVAVSRFTAGLVQRVGVHPDRIEVVYPGCDSTQFSPRPENPELRRRVLGPRHRNRVILTTGNLVDRKGHDMVIRALAILRQSIPDVTYLVVGDGPSRSGLAALAASLGVQDRVVFAGRTPDDQLPDLYALSDVFVMPSRERENECDVEGFGIVYLEASACGKPVIGGRSGGVPEAIADGVSGLLVDPDSAEEIASALTRVLTDPELASRLGAQGRTRVVRDFTWRRMADRMHEILATAAARERRTAES